MIMIEYKGISQSLEKAIVEQMKDQIKQKLKPFESEIKSQSGEIIINIPTDFDNIDIRVINISEELKNRIIASLK